MISFHLFAKYFSIFLPETRDIETKSAVTTTHFILALWYELARLLENILKVNGGREEKNSVLP